MHATDLVLLYDYTYWARDKILNAAERITPEQFEAPAAFPMGSLRGTLVHGLSAEWIWRMRCSQGQSPAAMWTEADLPTLADIRERWAEEERLMRAYLASLSDADLAATITYANTRGQLLSGTLWQILTHVVFHGMQHRTEAAAILTGYGASPGDIDLILFTRQVA